MQSATADVVAGHATGARLMGSSSPVEAILRAIREHRCLMLNYRNYSRVVEPYALGTDGDGAGVLCAYQVSGGDEAHVGQGWKRFEVGAISGATVVSGRFTGQRHPPPELAPARVTLAVMVDPALAAPPAGPERRRQPRPSG